MVSHTETTATPPRTAVWLGALGGIPFAALAAIVLIGDETSASAAVFAVVAYGAVILSFLGGAHWGFASRGIRDHPAQASRLLILSVVPSLAGWAAVLVPAPWSAAGLAVAFAAILPLDRWAAGQALAPVWWMRLRIPLSATVSLLLATAFVAALVRFGA